jgi:hypothetical protein
LPQESVALVLLTFSQISTSITLAVICGRNLEECKDAVASSGMVFIPSFMTVCQFIQKLPGDTNTHTQIMIS